MRSADYSFEYEVTPGTLRGFQLRELWQYRHLVILLAWRNIRVRYKQSILGIGWALLAPVGFTITFVMLFTLFPIKVSGDLPYVPATLSGMILWQFFSRALAEGGSSLTSNSSLITKVYFPRVILPLASIIASFADFLIALVLLGAVMFWYGIVPGVVILAAPVFVLFTIFLVTALSLWLSAIDGLYRDVRHALPLLLQFGMFASPVAYTTAAVIPSNWRWLYELNPMAALIEGFRWALLPGSSSPYPSAMLSSLFVTAVLLVTGSVFFARVERTIVDRV